LAQVLARNNLSLDALDEVFRQQVLSRKIGQKLTAGSVLTSDQVDLRLRDRLVATARSMRIRINPRYGTFDPNLGQINPVAFDFLRLSE